MNEEQNKNKILKDENKALQNKINKLIEDNNTNIENYESDIYELKEKNNELEKLIDEQKQEINDYILKLKNLVESEDKIISVLFMTMGNHDIINYSMACKTTDLFSSLEERFYKDFPEYRNKEIVFMANTNKISKLKTLEENKIKQNDIICLFQNEQIN